MLQEVAHRSQLAHLPSPLRSLSQERAGEVRVGQSALLDQAGHLDRAVVGVPPRRDVGRMQWHHQREQAGIRQDLGDRTKEVEVAEGARFGMGMPVKPVREARVGRLVIGTRRGGKHRAHWRPLPHHAVPDRKSIGSRAVRSVTPRGCPASSPIGDLPADSVGPAVPRDASRALRRSRQAVSRAVVARETIAGAGVLRKTGAGIVGTETTDEPGITRVVIVGALVAGTAFSGAAGDWLETQVPVTSLVPVQTSPGSQGSYKGQLARHPGSR